MQRCEVRGHRLLLLLGITEILQSELAERPAFGVNSTLDPVCWVIRISAPNTHIQAAELKFAPNVRRQLHPGLCLVGDKDISPDSRLQAAELKFAPIRIGLSYRQERESVIKKDFQV